MSVFKVDPPEDDSKDFAEQAIGSLEVPKSTVTGAPSFQWHVGVYSKRWAPYMQTCGGSLVKRDFVISGSSPVLLPGTSAPSFQWHVGVYSKRWAPYMQTCGGSLVKRDSVISAAHCFWDDATGQQPASHFAVAGGKLFRLFCPQVSQIYLPVRFRGGATSFQEDIAVLLLSTSFTYTPGVQPVCVNFDAQFQEEQLQPENMGTVLGWGLTEENGTPSQRLTYLDLPYVGVDECFADSEPSFHKYITSDKICAGDTVTGKALCRGDSGGGFVIYSGDLPYLHGVASAAAANKNLCNAFAIATFTSVYPLRAFLTRLIPGIDKECTPEATVSPDRINLDLETEDIGTAGPVVAKTNVTNLPYFPYPSNFVCNCNCKP
ncbi:trypsin zeta-like [Cydia fagiglandana]|uniref:trypsin zeta-like n=1 Tax=Cydia fagiglandana TaxID=1458189 RepID=UPI002FEE0C66